MKKETTFQALFDRLPIDLINEHPLEDDGASTETVERIMTTVSSACMHPQNHKTRRRFTWLIPAVAVMMSVIVVAGAALSHNWFSPTYSFSPPAIRSATIVPIVEEYEHAVDVNVVTEHDNLRVTLDKYVLDTVDGVLRATIEVQTTDGSVLTELSAERMSLLTRTSFKKASLTADGLKENNDAVSVMLNQGNTAYIRRSDSGNQPDRAVFEYRYYYNGGDGEDLVGKTFTLQLTNLRDEVQVTKDIGFTYESMQALYDDMKHAKNSDYIQGSVETELEYGSVVYYHSLKSGKQKIRFSTLHPDAYIDNIGFRGGLDRNFEWQLFNPQLYVSFSGISSWEQLPVLLDTRNGGLFRGIVDPENTDERVTVIYKNVSEDDLPYLFMMQEQESDIVTRAKGMWELTFTADDAMLVHAYEMDVDLKFHQFDIHATKITMTDCSLYVECAYTVVPIDEDDVAYGSIYGTIDLVLNDGTILKNPFYQGPSAEFGTLPADSGYTRWGGEFTEFIDTSKVVAVIALGQTIPLV